MPVPITPEPAGHLTAGVTSMSRSAHARIYRPDGLSGWILHQTVDGRGSLFHADERPIRPGAWLLFPAGAVHDYGLAAEAESWQHRWIYFWPEPDWFGWLEGRELPGGVRDLGRQSPASDPRTPLFQDLIAVARGEQLGGAVLARNLLEQLLIRCHLAGSADNARPLDPRLQDLLSWLEVHHAEPLTIADLADSCGLSPSRLAHHFRTQMGLTPMQHLEQLRLRRAAEQLLMSARPIAAIAEDVGLPDPTWFARVFKRRFGCTPRQFRQRG